MKTASDSRLGFSGIRFKIVTLVMLTGLPIVSFVAQADEGEPAAVESAAQELIEESTQSLTVEALKLFTQLEMSGRRIEDLRQWLEAAALTSASKRAGRRGSAARPQEYSAVVPDSTGDGSAARMPAAMTAQDGSAQGPGGLHSVRRITVTEIAQQSGQE